MRWEEIDELRPLTAGRLLSLWQACRERTEDPLERTLLCNARILAECCFCRGEPAFSDEKAVLGALTGRQMTELLGRLARAEAPREETVNPAFDWERFRALEE